MAREPDWSGPELAVIKRVVGSLRRGEFRSILAAARACQSELRKVRARRRGAEPTVYTRSLEAIHFRIRMETRNIYAELPFRRRQPGEVRMVRRYVWAYLAGRYASLRAATVACAREFSRQARRPRPFYGVYWMMHSTAHAMGIPKLKSTWTPKEKRVLNRYLQWLFEGRYNNSHEAARDCCRALGGSRTYKAVRHAIATRTACSALPMWHGCLRSHEQRLVERHALMVHRGQLSDWLVAARQCKVAIDRANQRLARTAGLKPRCPPSRPLGSIHQAILRLAHERGLRGPRNLRWTATENKLAAAWIRWFDRYRLVHRLKPLLQASEGLENDLADRGFQRTVGACRARVGIGARRLRQEMR